VPSGALLLRLELDSNTRRRAGGARTAPRSKRSATYRLRGWARRSPSITSSMATC